MGTALLIAAGLCGLALAIALFCLARRVAQVIANDPYGEDLDL